jgi:hypothetical protein
VIGIASSPPLSALCKPSLLDPPTSRASGHHVMPWRRGMEKRSPVSNALTPTKATWPRSAAEAAAKPGNSASQATHHDAKKLTTSGRPAKSVSRMWPAPSMRGRSHAARSVE